MWLIVAALVAVGRPPYHIFLSGPPRAVLEWALRGARRRLAAAGCRQIFADFSDDQGRAIAEHVTAAGVDAGDILAGLYFADGDATPQCRHDEGRAAFTEAGSHVVHVCGRRFGRFAAAPQYAEVLLIHELLHALGLGENPPTSAQITAAVINRCGH